MGPALATSSAGRQVWQAGVAQGAPASSPMQKADPFACNMQALPLP